MKLDLADWRLWAQAAHLWFDILLIWLLAALALRLTRRVLHALRLHIATHSERLPNARRIETLMNVFRYTANVVIFGVAIMLTLDTFGISVTPLLATAGVAGIAIGFGAQSLVKDFFTGLFLLIENQVSEGDLIEAAGKTGTVEAVTLRHLRVRDADGSLHYIPNSMVTTVTNRSRDYGYAVIELALPRQKDPGPVRASMKAVGEALRADPILGGVVVGPTEVDGFEKLEEASYVLRCRLRTAAGEQGRVRRAFLERMKAELDGAGGEDGGMRAE